MNIQVEICCGSVEDVIKSHRQKVDRIELNSALFMGGLTPSLAMLIQSKEITSIPILCMVRSRGAGFTYSKVEIETMRLDAETLLAHKADGIVFGALKADASIDIEQTKFFVDLAHQHGKSFVFHKAFDVSADLDVSIQQLIELKVDRVLTSGGYTSAQEGIEKLAYLQNKYGSYIEILVGGGVRSENALSIINKSFCTQIHSSARGYAYDPTTQNAQVSYNYTNPEFHYEEVDELKVKALMSVKKQMELT
jgi:copper homeostasis protein